MPAEGKTPQGGRKSYTSQGFNYDPSPQCCGCDVPWPYSEERADWCAKCGKVLSAKTLRRLRKQLVG